jgi:hypothetical protein
MSMKKMTQFFLFKDGFFLRFFMYLLYSTLLSRPPLRFHCVGGCWDRTQDSCDFGICCQTLYPHFMHFRPHLNNNSATSHPHLTTSHPHPATSHLHSATSHPQLGYILSTLGYISSTLSYISSTLGCISSTVKI